MIFWNAKSPLDPPKQRFKDHKQVAFSLIELLVAVTIFAMLVVALSMISDQAMKIWSRNESNSDMRESARTAINLIGSELRQAALPVYRADQTSLQLVVNPPPSQVAATFKNHDAFFWQAPIATSRTKGDLAVVGYFVRKTSGNNGKLCRFFINPDDADYAVHGGAWVSDALLESHAPADDANDLKGLFLENVPGMWVSAYDDTGAKLVDYDSRVQQKYPARVEITLALLNKSGAERVAGGQLTLPQSQAYDDPETYLSQVPAPLLASVQLVKINVSFLF